MSGLANHNPVDFGFSLLACDGEADGEVERVEGEFPDELFVGHLETPINRFCRFFQIKWA